MTNGSVAFTLGEALLEPRAIEPVRTRWWLVLVLVFLTSTLHIATGGWGDLYNETDGQYASAARAMTLSGDWLVPENNGIPRLVKPPFLYWMLACSFECFGPSEFASRLPMALSILALVLAVFFIGERVGGTWCGFSAGLVLLMTPGLFVLGRVVMPEPPFSAAIAWSIYALLRLYETRGRDLRFVWLAWFCAALAVWVKGPHGLLYPLVIAGLAACFWREARLRFRPLISPWGILLFLAMNLPWYFLIEQRFPGYLKELFVNEHLGHLLNTRWPPTQGEGVPRLEFLLLHIAWFFPWSIVLFATLLLDPKCFKIRGEWDFHRALPWFWALVVIVPVVLAGQRQDYYSMPGWGALAIGMAFLLSQISMRVLVCSGAIAAACGGVIAFGLRAMLNLQNAVPGTAVERATAWDAVRGLPDALWSSVYPIGVVAASSLVLFGLLTAGFALASRRRMAILAYSAMMIPVGFGMIEGVGKAAPFFSFSEFARELNQKMAPDALVVFEGNPHLCSSLGFYLDSNYSMVGVSPDFEFAVRTTGIGKELFLDEAAFLHRWGGEAEVWLILEESELPKWKKLGVEGEVVSRHGSHVLIRNSPTNSSASHPTLPGIDSASS